MSRISLRLREQLDEAGRTVFDEIMESRGKVDDAFQALLPAPELLRRIANLGAYVRFGSSLGAAVRECVILATAHFMSSEFEWNDHRPQALAAGVSEATIGAIAQGVLPSSAGAERAVVQFTYETLRDRNVSDATFAETVTRFGIAGTAEVAATIGFYSMLANILIVFNVSS